MNVLERLISHLEGQVTTLKVQLDRKDSIINILLEKLEKHDNERSHKCQCEKNNLSVSQNISVNDNENESATQINFKNMNNNSQSQTNKSTPSEKPNKPPTEKSNPSEDNPATMSTSRRNSENENENESSIAENSNTGLVDPKQSNKTSKSVVILGDSMTKHWEMVGKFPRR